MIAAGLAPAVAAPEVAVAEGVGAAGVAPHRVPLGAVAAGAEPEAAGGEGPSSCGEALGPVRGVPVRWDGLTGVPVEAFEVGSGCSAGSRQ